jgi:hypothetical protein
VHTHGYESSGHIIRYDIITACKLVVGAEIRFPPKQAPAFCFDHSSHYPLLYQVSTSTVQCNYVLEYSYCFVQHLSSSSTRVLEYSSSIQYLLLHTCTEYSEYLLLLRVLALVLVGSTRGEYYSEYMLRTYSVLMVALLSTTTS